MSGAEEAARAGDEARATVRGRRLAAAAALLPAVLWLVLLPRFGPLESNDYYWIFGSVVSSTQEVHGPLDLLRIRSNEHHVVLPALVYFANFELTRGDNRGLSLLAILLLAAEIALLVRLLAPGSREGPLAAAALGLGVGVLVATPAVAHCVVLGFSGAIWCLAAFLSVAAVSGLVWAVESRPGRVPWTAMVPAALGSLANTSALAVWPALVVGALLLRLRWRQVLLLAACGAVAVGAYVGTYRPMAAHPDPNTGGDPGLLLGHAAAVLGSPLAAWWWLAAVLGGLGVGAVAVLAVVVARRGDGTGRGRAAGWAMLAVWSTLTAVGIAVGRSGFGLEQALQSRYVTVAAPLWVGLVGLVVAAGRRQRGWMRGAALVLALALATATMLRGLPVLRSYLHRAQMQPLARQALRLGVDDPQVLRFLTPAVPQLLRFRPYLKALHHVPFDDREARRPRTLPGMAVSDDLLVLEGDVVVSQPVGDRWVRVEGWTAREVDLVAVDRAGRVVAEMVTTPRLSGGPRWGPDRHGWAGYVRRGDANRRLEVVAPELGAGIAKPVHVPARRDVQARRGGPGGPAPPGISG